MNVQNFRHIKTMQPIEPNQSLFFLVLNSSVGELKRLLRNCLNINVFNMKRKICIKKNLTNVL